MYVGKFDASLSSHCWFKVDNASGGSSRRKLTHLVSHFVAFTCDLVHEDVHNVTFSVTHKRATASPLSRSLLPLISEPKQKPRHPNRGFEKAK